MTFQPNPDRYDGRMPYRRCGQSGLHLPAFSLGFWHNFGDGDDLGEARRLVHYAFDQGIIHFDFANNYGPPPGSAERNVGRILREDFAHYRDELLIATKAGYRMWPGPYGEWGSRKYLMASLDQSLQRLGLDYVDIYYSHRPDPHTPLEETMGALADIVRQGKALYVGLSSYPRDMLEQAVEILQSLGQTCVIYQPPYSLLERGVEHTGILHWLHEHGIGCIGFSPLAQGMLTDKYRHGIPEGSRAARPEGFLDISDFQRNRTQLQKLHGLAIAWEMPLQHLAIRWLLQNRLLTSILVGVRTVSQLADLLQPLAASDLTYEQVHELERAASPKR